MSFVEKTCRTHTYKHGVHSYVIMSPPNDVPSTLFSTLLPFFATGGHGSRPRTGHVSVRCTQSNAAATKARSPASFLLLLLSFVFFLLSLSGDLSEALSRDIAPYLPAVIEAFVQYMCEPGLKPQGESNWEWELGIGKQPVPSLLSPCTLSPNSPFIIGPLPVFANASLFLFLC